jgi:hypothetical protein
MTLTSSHSKVMDPDFFSLEMQNSLRRNLLLVLMSDHLPLNHLEANAN